MVASASVEPANHPDQQFELWSVPAFETGEPEIKYGADIGSTKQMVEVNDVLLCKINPRINRVWKVNGPAGIPRIASPEWIILRPEYIDSDFLVYALREHSIREILCANVSGVGGSLTRVRPSFVRELHISLPPLQEQRRIALEVKKQQTHIRRAREELEVVISKTREYQTSVLAEAYSGELTESWRRTRQPGRDAASTWLEELHAERRRRIGVDGKGEGKRRSLKDEMAVSVRHVSSPKLPEGWEWMSLDEISWNASYGTSQKCDYSASGTPVLRIPNIVNGSIDMHDLKFAVTTLELNTDSALQPGDLLIVRTNGSKDLVGKAAVIREELEAQTYFASYLIRFRLLGIPTLWRWVSLLMQSPQQRVVIEDLAATTAGQYNLSLSKLRSVGIPLPPRRELEELLNQVDTRLTAATSVRDVVQEQLQRLESLDRAVLYRAVRGELVPQDPSDEPASNILLRIREDSRQEAAPKRNRVKRELVGLRLQSVTTLEEMLLRLDQLGGSASPEALLEASGLGEDVDSFFDLLRQGRDTMVIDVPVGVAGEIRRRADADS